ncbi:hypothetical protein [Massilia aquatica]|uniref:Piwi domain-containing protein n=1 Tax=Massilia aquatica TaxID=2609000 RepID=A0ABX0MCP2_9BURK|nr:hypothetical protein [Massilia aquatica]NHZ44954.1 hypothetical protein [Massilia aquatica]
MPEPIFQATIRKFDQERVHPARLNGCTITEPAAAATGKLLDLLNVDATTTVSLRSMRVVQTVTPTQLPQHLAKMRRLIAESCGVASVNVILHRDAQDGRRYYFVAPRTCRVGIPVTRTEDVDQHRVFKLALETLLLRKSALFRENLHAAIGPQGSAARLYLHIASRTSAKTRRRHLDCLLLDLTFDSHMQLMIDARRRCFSVPEEAAVPASAITPFAIGESVARIALIDLDGARREDARKAPSRSAVRDITFDIGKIKSSRWFAIDQTLGMVRAILSEAGIRTDDLVFLATHYLDKPFIRPEHLAIPSRLSVAFADSLKPTDLSKKLLEAQIRSGFGKNAAALAVDWITQSSINPARDLATDHAYLFINHAAAQEQPIDFGGDEQDTAYGGYDTDGDITSCLLRGEAAEPENAYLSILSGKATVNEVDFYTRLKYLQHVASSSCRACFQGVDVVDSIDELSGSHKLAKVLAEIALKWALAQGTIVLASPLPPMRLRALYTRAGRNGPAKGLEAIAHIDLQVAGHGASATLTAHRIPPTEPVRIAQAVQAQPLIRRSRDGGDGAPAKTAGVVTTGLRDATFVMELLPDQGDGSADSDCLVVYDGSTVRIPRIIGSMQRAPLHTCLETMLTELPPGQKSLPRTKDANLLPYYIAGFEEQVGREYVFIESRNPHYLRYFVPQAQPTATSFAFSRFYDIMLYKKGDHRREDPIPATVDHPLVRAFFSMMTQDVVRLGENGKHTLLRKLAGLALLN